MSELLTVAEVAAVLHCSEETVARRFSKAKGVIDLSEGGMKKRRYRILRIPTSVVERYIAQRGGRITVDVPPSPVKKPVAGEDAITRDLAALASQHGEAGRQTLQRIERRARAMTHVPSDRWQDMVWVDEDD